MGRAGLKKIELVPRLLSGSAELRDVDELATPSRCVRIHGSAAAAPLSIASQPRCLKCSGTREEQSRRLPPSPRLRGEGWGEGLLCEFAKEHAENTVQILNNIIVPDAHNTITESAQLAVALPVFGSFRVLAAVEFDNQAPLAANKIDVVSIDR